MLVTSSSIVLAAPAKAAVSSVIISDATSHAGSASLDRAVSVKVLRLEKSNPLLTLGFSKLWPLT